MPLLWTCFELLFDQGHFFILFVSSWPCRSNSLDLGFYSNFMRAARVSHCSSPLFEWTGWAKKAATTMETLMRYLFIYSSCVNGFWNSPGECFCFPFAGLFRFSLVTDTGAEHDRGIPHFVSVCFSARSPSPVDDDVNLFLFTR